MRKERTKTPTQNSRVMNLNEKMFMHETKLAFCSLVNKRLHLFYRRKQDLLNNNLG